MAFLGGNWFEAAEAALGLIENIAV